MTKAPQKKMTSFQNRFPERPPEVSWWVSALDERGKKQWFLRILVTGLYPRRYGPFDSQALGLYFLSVLLNEAESAMVEMENKLPSYSCRP